MNEYMASDVCSDKSMNTQEIQMKATEYGTTDLQQIAKIDKLISQKLKEKDKQYIKDFEELEKIHKREIESILNACMDKNGLIDKDLCVRDGVGTILKILSKYE